MIEHTLDTAHAILHLRVKAPLERSDFEQLAAEVDPYIEKSGDLAGLIIEAPTFPPRWKTFGALTSQLRFVRDHHKHIKKIALVTDSRVGDVAADLVSHLVSPEIKRFPTANLDAASQWIGANE